VELIVASGDAAELLELAEKAFDAVASTVAFFVERHFSTPGRQGWDHRFDAIQSQPFTDSVGVVTHVQTGGFQNIFLRQAFIQGFELAAVMSLPRGHVECDRTVFVDGGDVDFCAKSPARPPQSLIGALFFGAPAACG